MSNDKYCHMIKETGHATVRPRCISLAIVFIAAALMSGCAVGPNFQRPTAPTVDRYTPQPLPAQTASVEVKGGEAQRFVQDMDIPRSMVDAVPFETAQRPD